VRGRGKEVDQTDRRGKAEVSLPVLRLGTAVLGTIGVTEEELGEFVGGRLRGRLRQPRARALIRSKVAGVGAVFSDDDVNSTAHFSSVTRPGCCVEDQPKLICTRNHSKWLSRKEARIAAHACDVLDGRDGQRPKRTDL
jgi:hypothetical protein